MANYKYYNRNPYNQVKSDCVCRAISTATDLQYDAVNNLLKLTADTYSCERLCVCCYHRLLEDVLCYKRNTCHNHETVEDIARQFPRDKILVRIDSHLTCIIKGAILDI